MSKLTGRDLDVARRALGLPNHLNRSYRNRYIAGPGHHSYAEWKRLVAAGLAEVSTTKPPRYGGADLFWLTREGANAALEPGESLDRVDFPTTSPTAGAGR